MTLSLYILSVVMQVSILFNAFTYRSSFECQGEGDVFFLDCAARTKRERDGRATRPVIYDILQTNKQ